MKVDLRIEEQLDELFSQMGLTEEQVNEQYKLLMEKIEGLCCDFLNQTYQKVCDFKNEAEGIEKQIRELEEFSGVQSGYKMNPSASLNERIDSAKVYLNDLTEITATQKNEFEQLYVKLNTCFNKLEITERGEFAEKGDIFRSDKIELISNKINELDSIISENEEIVNNLSKKLTELHNLLGLEQFVKPETCGDPTIESLQDELQELTDQYNNNYEDSQATIKEIRRLERLLGKRVSSQRITVFSDAAVSDLHKRLDDLNEEKEQNLGQVVESLKNELLRLWGELNMETPSKSSFPFFYASSPNKRTLIALESEVLRLENLKESIQPLLALIAQRDDIINSYNDQSAIANDPGRLTSRRGGVASSLMQEERVRRRYANELPKIHEQMVGMLEDYEETYGEPFMWNGVNLLEEIREMQEKEPASQKMKRQTISNKTKTRQIPLNQRAPFILPGYMN
ncbi:hypothetical protein TVAG_195920 [Trichomonas vaginalis G3]|uniref:Protein regulator of cytokinesis 1 n=1 Tax=Trichomonas vaginalis (strain ATCC PRA-98 / G3) TaxID=412133 RepID=A2ETN1_TRIV3|nr:microtubule binding [Trichomonas vaginalis G3]EAY03999.1 hypothetical protein TVAG_195920 [Trichomonas vaginalis G3]KAI5534913.1 microtubule binding [Trichomonas vaginalis G3]|eukprot:XP_001316222.1 hypothetical protein [Trichomonas vaginalis G3]